MAFGKPEGRKIDAARETELARRKAVEDARKKLGKQEATPLVQEGK